MQQHSLVASNNKQKQHFNGAPASNQMSARYAVAATHQPQPQSRAHLPQQTAPMTQLPPQVQYAPLPIRVTLPMNELPLLGPFKLDHDTQYSTHAFTVQPKLLESVSKSMNANPHTAVVIHEIQFRAHLTAIMQQASNYQPAIADSCKLIGACDWPTKLLASINQQMLNLDRMRAQRNAPADIKLLVSAGLNSLEMQANACICTHGFIIEAVERPTLKAFMSSCIRDKQLPIDASIRKLKANFDLPNFLVSTNTSRLAPINANSERLLQLNKGASVNRFTIVENSYISEYNTEQGFELLAAKLSLVDIFTSRRISTPARGKHCKHAQCFDLESFLTVNCDDTQWQCPLCAVPIPFSTLEIDAYMANVLSEVSNSDLEHVLVFPNGRWKPSFVNSANVDGSVPAHIVSSPPQRMQPCRTVQQPQATQAKQPQQHQSLYSAPVNHGILDAGVQGQFSQLPHSNHPQMGMAQQAPQARKRQAPSQSHQQHQWQHSHIDDQQLSAFSDHPQQMMPHQQQARNSPSISPLTKRTCQSSHYDSPKYLAGSPAASVMQGSQAALMQNSNPLLTQAMNSDLSIDELDPLAAIERTVYQHEQAITPLSALTKQTLINDSSHLQQQRGNFSSSDLNSSNQQTSSSAFSPASAVASPAQVRQSTSRSMASSSMSPRITSQNVTSNDISSTSTPATPLSNSFPNCDVGSQSHNQYSNQSSLQQQQHHIYNPSGDIQSATPGVSSMASSNSSSGIGSVGASSSSSLSTSNVDQQPMSNGPSSVHTSSSLGSVGLGGDSRCATAIPSESEQPKQQQSTHGKIETGSQQLLSQQQKMPNLHITSQEHSESKFDTNYSLGSDDDDLLMSKMMDDDASESLVLELFNN